MAINLTKNEEQLTESLMGKINLSKDKEKLGGHVVNLSKCVVNLSKKAEVDLGNTKARVIAVLDYSGSMSELYSKGVVQKVLNKLVPLGLTFDDNGEIESYLFSTGFKKLPEITLENYSDYIKKVAEKSGFSMGCTEYAPVLEDIRDLHQVEQNKNGGFFSKLFGKKQSLENTAVNLDENILVIFITDGDNSDKSETNKVIRELSETKTFIQFVGIGNSKFSYLEKLDNLSDRKVDNTGFTKFSDISKVEDTELYTNVLEQFADWLKIVN